MRINFAHIQAPAAAGGRINYVVFEAKSNSGNDRDNGALLLRLTVAARQQRLRVDQSALAFISGGQLRFYGTATLVEHLSRSGLPRWTHYLDI